MSLNTGDVTILESGYKQQFDCTVWTKRLIFLPILPLIKLKFFITIKKKRKENHSYSVKKQVLIQIPLKTLSKYWAMACNTKWRSGGCGGNPMGFLSSLSMSGVMTQTFWKFSECSRTVDMDGLLDLYPRDLIQHEEVNFVPGFKPDMRKTGMDHGSVITHTRGK